MAAVSLGVGVAAGSRITSPEDAAAKTAAPKASQITVPVEAAWLDTRRLASRAQFSSCLGDNCQSSVLYGLVRSSQVRLGDDSVQSGLVWLQSALVE